MQLSKTRIIISGILAGLIIPIFIFFGFEIIPSIYYSIIMFILFIVITHAVFKKNKEQKNYEQQVMNDEYLKEKARLEAREHYMQEKRFFK